MVAGGKVGCHRETVESFWSERSCRPLGIRLYSFLGSLGVETLGYAQGEVPDLGHEAFSAEAVVGLFRGQGESCLFVQAAGSEEFDLVQLSVLARRPARERPLLDRSRSRLRIRHDRPI